MNSIGDRVKTLRKSLNLSLTTFGARVGITAPNVLRIEQGSANATKNTLKAICSEFNVNYDWITKGEGPIFATIVSKPTKPAIEMLAEEYNLNEADKVILKTFLELPSSSRTAIQNAVKSIYLAMNKEAKTTKAKTKKASKIKEASESTALNGAPEEVSPIKEEKKEESSSQD